MNALLRSSLLILVLTLLAACGSSTPDDTTQPPATQPETEPEQPDESEPAPEPAPKPDIRGNNSAVLSGPALGSGTTDVSFLRKEVPVTVQTPNSSFELGSIAYVMRDRTDQTASTWLFSVRNVSDQIQCFVQLEDVVLRDAEGQVLLDDGTTFAYGSVADLGSNIWTSSCLDTGEQAYFIGIDIDTNYADIASFSVSGFDAIADGGRFRAPPTTVTPQSYSVSERDISIAVQNANAATELRSSLYIQLDDADEPLTWGFASDTSDNSILQAGEARLLTSFDFYEGPVSQKIYVTVNFDTPEEDTSALQTLSAGDRLEQRNLIEQAKLERLQAQ